MSKGYMSILECCDGTFYTGSTKDLELRLNQHQNGVGANYTARRLPVKLLYYEEFQRIDDAFYKEKQVQGWSRKKKEALIKNNYSDLVKFAVCQNETHSDNIDFDSAQSPKITKNDNVQDSIQNRIIK